MLQCYIVTLLQSDQSLRSVLKAFENTARCPRYYVSLGSMLRLVLRVEVVIDNLGFGGPDEVAERFEIGLTNLLDRFKAI